MFLALPFGQYLVGAEADCGVLYLLAFTAFVLIAVVTGGWSARERWTPGRAARALLDAVSSELPAAIGVLCVVVAGGTLRVQEIIRAQGGWPWDWYALKSPVTVAVFLLFFSTALVDEERGPRELIEADLGRRAHGAHGAAKESAQKAATPRMAFFFFAEQAKTFVLCALAAAIFLGGWQLPGVAPAQQESQRTLEIAGAVLFAMKAWGLVLAVAWARWALPRVPASQMTRAAWKYLVPAALACLLLSLGWLAWSPGRGAQRMMSVAIAAGVALAVAYLVHRVRYSFRSTRVALNPFL
jgi:NADH-quinone oxidoreductase subunit H